MKLKYIFIFILLLSYFQSNANDIVDTITIDIKESKYDFFYKIKVKGDSLVKKIVLFNDSTGQKIVIDKFDIIEKDTFINLGNHFEEGVYEGYINKNRTKKIAVVYGKKQKLTLNSGNRTFIYHSDFQKEFIVPVEFNINPPIKFDFICLPLFIKDSEKFIKHLNIHIRNGHYFIDSTVYNLKSGSYAGNLVFEKDGEKYSQPLEINIKDGFAYGVLALIISFIVSYIVRYFSINEKKANAFRRAKELLVAIEKDSQLDPIKQKELIKELHDHINEINLWIFPESYYQEEFSKIFKSYQDPSNKARTFSVQEEEEIIRDYSKLEIINKGIKWIHVFITFLFCLLIFKLIYVDNPIFGSDLITDYFKLLVGVLLTVLTSEGLIKERITLLNSKLG